MENSKKQSIEHQDSDEKSLEFSPEHINPGLRTVKDSPINDIPDKLHASLKLIPSNNNKDQSEDKKIA